MSILLDTHVFLWAFGDRRRLGGAALDILENGPGPLFFSAVSSWEIAIKWSKGHLELPENPNVCISEWVARAGLTPLSVSVRDSCRVADLPFHHRDPFDRLLIAQAMANGLRIMTADPVFQKYDVNVLWD